jgi:hypothetical protein
MTASVPRPRIVDAAFWCWISVAILLAFYCGTLALSSGNPAFYRIVHAVLAAAGLGIGGLAFPTRNGDNRFRWASVGLSFVLIGLMIYMTLWTSGRLWLVVDALLLVAATLITRQTAQQWFDAVKEQGRGGE